ncbi:hypothetical protein ACSFBL_04305, partial [Variovorax sp. GT1P44]
ASKTMRTARSMTSGENFGDFLILAPFSIEGASSKSGAVQSTRWRDVNQALENSFDALSAPRLHRSP